MADFDLSYEGALVAAGATVHAFQEFGSYQGEWWAKVTYNGETGWVSGSYGSCSGCDALQGQFGWGFGETEEWDSEYHERRPKSAERLKEERDQFADFGRSYLEDMIFAQEEAEAEAARNIEWDMEAMSVVDFIRANA